MVSCPECSATDADIIGVEVPGVYDGVLYWQCGKCGLAWNRWADTPGRRADIAESYVIDVNTARAGADDDR